jgi:hypothetical protein
MVSVAQFGEGRHSKSGTSIASINKGSIESIMAHVVS